MTGQESEVGSAWTIRMEREIDAIPEERKIDTPKQQKT